MASLCHTHNLAGTYLSWLTGGLGGLGGLGLVCHKRMCAPPMHAFLFTVDTC